ncbi:plant intracellular Ras-group-related LRR protein 5-like [Mercurialis annua]|uniref:plant intracellular Ras-group-related LRR protein 5-like n=1 Tax=Mercurialis annua TaxID=3986 RepID=UPI00215F16A2|nr:plant intracellular Ras-group-related LRR protein 5-like [Mercurialis annua]
MAAIQETVEEIMSLYRSLPKRPSIEEVEAAMSVIESVNTEEQQNLDEFSNQECPQNVPNELFSVLKLARRTMVLFRSHEQKKEALHVLEVDKLFETFDGFIQKASVLVSGDNQMEKMEVYSFSDPVEKFVEENIVKEENLIKGSSSNKPAFFSGEDEPEKLSLMKVASIIENSAKSEDVVLDLKGKLMDKIEWLPLSIGKLSFVTELNLSENRIMALPTTICSLVALVKIDIHSNQLINLPDSFGELINLTDLDLHANRLKSLPSSFGNLKNLANFDLSSNQFTHLPESIGDLTSLTILNVETNELEELPYTIGNCSSLMELRLDFNQLRALPEAIGKLGSLEILSLHYNRIRGLPTTIGNLLCLTEFDVSFNELQSVPENLCSAVSLRKLNVSKNFADLTELPRSIGKLEMLEELDISDDQIRTLPDSFGLLSKLRVFRADETPLEVPPRHVAKRGSQAVVKFMADVVAKRDVKLQSLKKKKGFWYKICSILWPFRRNHR